MSRLLSRATTVLGLVVVMSVAGTGLASAHPVPVGVDPSNWRSSVTKVDPHVAGLSIRLGDDAQRLTVSVAGPVDLVVLGYDDEPFVRVNAQGVWLNQRSTTTWSVAGPSAVQPGDVDDHARPRWTQVSQVPSWRWHDARTHWPGYEVPPPVQRHPERRQFVEAWFVPIVVNGTTGLVTGRLDWVPGPNPAPGAALILGPLAALVATGLARRWRLAAATALVTVTVVDVVHAAGMVAGRIGGTWTRLAALPDHGVPNLLLWVGLLVCAAAILRRRHLTAALYAAAMLAATVFLADGVPSVALVWRSQAITGLPVMVDRYLVAVLTGASLGLLIATVLLICRLDRRTPAA